MGQIFGLDLTLEVTQQSVGVGPVKSKCRSGPVKCRGVQPSVGVAQPGIGVTQSSVGVAQPNVGVAQPSLKVIGWLPSRLYGGVVAHKILVSAKGTLVLSFWVWGQRVWGLGLTIQLIGIE